MKLDNYEVHMASSDDSNEGRILIKNKELEKIQGKRPIVCIKGVNFKPVYAEALYADDTYLKKRGMDMVFGKNDNVIFISAWYRHKLRIEAKKFPVKGSPKGSPVTTNLDIKPLSPLNLRAILYRYPRDHPQAVVLTANMMGIIGFGLGVIGTGLGVVGIHDWLEKHFSTSFTNFSDPIGIVVLVIGFLITFLGFTGLIRRR